MKVKEEHWSKLMEVYKRDFPEVRFVYKTDGDLPLKATLVTMLFKFLGLFSNRIRDWYFFDSVTVVDNVVMFPPSHSWEGRDIQVKTFIVLVHELRHLYQRLYIDKWEVKYLFLPLPIFITYRSDYEAEAYGDSLWARSLYGLDIGPSAVNHYVGMFTDYRYFWMSWNPDDVRVKLTKASEDIKKGTYKPLFEIS